ncbi:MAG TPA: hypothetical protein VF993_09410, partial [Myxococcales bacterium]
MNLRSAVSLSTLALALAACRPTARGLCASQNDCRDGSFCSQDGICLGPSSDCSPACATAEICSNHICVPLKPSLQILLAPGAVLSPSQAQVTVHVEAAASIPLHALVVNVVDANQKMVATGTAPGSPGDVLVALGSFQPNFAGTVSVSAYVTWDPPSGASQYARAPMVQAILDDQPPTVTVFVPTAPDDVQGWIPRTSGTAEVRAQVDDGQGSGPDSATLTFDACPAAVPCTYAGAAQGGGSFSFQVPRMAQAAGVASALSFTVTGKDKGGNANTASDALQIDDSAPQIGAFSLVTNGVTGEDGNTWFLGGPGAPAVEIVLPVSDTGVGLGTVTASL